MIPAPLNVPGDEIVSLSADVLEEELLQILDDVSIGRLRRLGHQAVEDVFQTFALVGEVVGQLEVVVFDAVGEVGCAVESKYKDRNIIN